MCNPNSSIANRRYRSAQLRGGGATSSRTSSMLTQNLLGSLFVNKNPASHDGVDDSAVQKGESFPLTSTQSTLPSLMMKKEQTIVAPSHHHSSHYVFSPVLTTLSAYQQVRTIHNPQVPKSKPKRKRKPQKPGKTAKQNDRHFVVHNYHDHANDIDDGDVDCEEPCKRRGGVSVSFPLKLHQVLEQVEVDGHSHVVSWQPHGRCFVIHKPKEFTDHIMPHYFRQTKLTSFQRQLNLYGFQRLTRGADSGGYYHELFLRGKDFLCKHMVRTKVKGTKFKAASSPDQEPDFYSMAPVAQPITPSTSDCDNSDDGYYTGRVGYHSQMPPPDVVPLKRQRSGEADYYPPPMSSSSSYRPLVTPKLPSAEMNPIPYYPPSYVEQVPAPGASLQQMMPPRQVQHLVSSSEQQPQLPTASPVRLSTTSASGWEGQSFSGGDILDETVDDLFLGEDNQSNDSILDFVSAWDYGAADAALTNDVQLGNLLDKLLEE